jgi:hypothetical protein
MKNKNIKNQNTRVNVLLIIFRGLYFLTIVSIALMVLFLVVMLVSGVYPLNALGFNFPVYFDMIQSNGVAMWSDQTTTPVKMTNVMGSIWLSDIPNVLLVVSSFFSILVIGFGIQSIRLSIRILESVKFRKFFLIENAVRLRWIALFNIAAFLFVRMNSIFTSNYLGSRMELVGIEFENINLHMLFGNVDIVIFNLFLLIIAEVFRVGAEMKNEQDLTI